MKFAELIDRVIEPFDPARVRRRLAERQALEAIRDYDAAGRGRRTQGWRRPGSSPDSEVRRGLVQLRNGARELVRNNKYAAAALQQMVANAVGDGIQARAVHPDEGVAKIAQAAWDKWAESPVDGRHDFYGVQRLGFRTVIEGGESGLAWDADDTGPDGEVRVFEGDLIDHTKNDDSVAGGGRIVQGVETDKSGRRVAYWLYDHHPGDGHGLSRGGLSKRYAAAHIDHVYDELRPGQTRGVSWFAPVMMTLRDLADFEDAVLMKKKVEACLALILTPPDNGPPTNPFDEKAQSAAVAPSASQSGKSPDTIRPGMVFRARPGETAHTLSPTSTGDGVEFATQQLAAIAANLAPYHLMTGDVSRANYSSLRAALLGFWANLDDWQQNILIPLMCAPAFRRRMRRLYLETGDKRFLDVTAKWAPPPRRFVDPIKDVTGEILEVRAGFKTMPQSLAERGRNWRDHNQEIADYNTDADAKKLALDTDPRRLTEAGVLQVAAGYLANPANTGN